MTKQQGIRGLEGADLLVRVSEYVPSLRRQAAAALLGALVDDPRSGEAALDDFFQPSTAPTPAVP